VKTSIVNFKIGYLLLYLFGILTLAFGVVLFKRAELGVAAWDTALLNLQSLLATRLQVTISTGTSSFIHTIMLLVIVVALNRSFKPMKALLPIVLIFLSIDLWDIYVLGGFVISDASILIKIAIFIVALLVMTFGLATIIVSGFPPNVYDDFHLTIIKVFKIKSFSKARWIVEFLGLGLGLLYALIEGQGLGAISFLSLVLAFVFGHFIKFFITIYQRLKIINRDL
jgi:uncharacterized membrane protein YczE